LVDRISQFEGLMGGTSWILGRWLRMRDKIKDGEKALFLNLVDSRLDPLVVP
jgi:hypothetical protein